MKDIAKTTVRLCCTVVDGADHHKTKPCSPNQSGWLVSLDTSLPSDPFKLNISVLANSCSASVHSWYTPLRNSICYSSFCIFSINPMETNHLIWRLVLGFLILTKAFDGSVFRKSLSNPEIPRHNTK